MLTRKRKRELESQEGIAKCQKLKQEQKEKERQEFYEQNYKAPWCNSDCSYISRSFFDWQVPETKHRLGCDLYPKAYFLNSQHCEAKCKECPMINVCVLLRLVNNWSDSEISPRLIYEYLQQAIETGHDVNQPFWFSDDDHVTKTTALNMVVALFNRIEHHNGYQYTCSLVEKLLSAGADPNEPIVDYVVSNGMKNSRKLSFTNSVSLLMYLVSTKMKFLDPNNDHQTWSDYVPQKSEWENDGEPLGSVKKVMKLLIVHGATMNFENEFKNYDDHHRFQMMCREKYIRDDIMSWTTQRPFPTCFKSEYGFNINGDVLIPLVQKSILFSKCQSVLSQIPGPLVQIIINYDTRCYHRIEHDLSLMSTRLIMVLHLEKFNDPYLVKFKSLFEAAEKIISTKERGNAQRLN